MAGKFIISLDFELMWGVRDHKTVESYGANINAVHDLTPTLLSLFDKYGISATFATVGFLFTDNFEQLRSMIPKDRPSYRKLNLSPYPQLLSGESPSEYYSYYFAPEIINALRKSGNHEISSHTFCHYYCLEDGQSEQEFEADLNSSINAAKKKGINLKTIVFPRNQVNHNYLNILRRYGFIAYRGNESMWIYKEVKNGNQRYLRRLLRLIDRYLAVSGSNTYKIDDIEEHSGIINLPASRFLSPYSQRLKMLEGLRLNRIKSEMTKAAKSSEVYHLWWHPHNFGKNSKENFYFLEEILRHYKTLERDFRFESITMKGMAQRVKQKNYE